MLVVIGLEPYDDGLPMAYGGFTGVRVHDQVIIQHQSPIRGDVFRQWIRRILAGVTWASWNPAEGSGLCH